MRIFTLPAIALAATVAIPCYANTGRVWTESVSDYTGCQTNNDVVNANKNADGFFNAVTQSGIFVKFRQRRDHEVWDGDFYDFDVSRGVADDDTMNFDAADDSVAIAYYAGHGAGTSVPAPTIACHHDSDCPLPPGRIGPGVCQTFPGSSTENGSNGTVPGLCRWGFDNAFYTCGANDTHDHLVKYGTLGSGIAWGESKTQPNPGWAGAGTNGGVNVVVGNSSYGTTAGFWQQTMVPPSAGIHMLALNMVVNGDTGVGSDLGSFFGQFASDTPFGSVGFAWTDGAMAKMPGSVAQGNCSGGKGYNGCGCNIVVATDTTVALAEWHVSSESWIGVLNDANDSGGNTFYAARYSCNYDANNFKFDIDR